MSIRLINLTKLYGELIVVNNLNLTIDDGELFVLLGGSGSGKSTILRLIAGLIKPDAGSVEMRGKDVTRVPAQKRGAGFVFQNYALFRHMSVQQNIEFPLRLRGAKKADRQRRSAELMEMVGLTGLGRRFASQLSGGQQQRVALARALAFEPSVLLLDEPFGALDVNIRAHLRRSLRDIQRQLGVTSILVTHDQEEAFELGDRIGVVERGHMIEVGRPQDLYHRPRTQFAAAFVGAGSVLVGRQEAGGVQLGTARLPHEEAEGSLVRLLIRPEHVELRPEPFEGALWEGEVAEDVFAGAYQRVRLKVEGLRGARVVAPTPAHGQRPSAIEAALPSDHSLGDLSVGRKLWIGLKQYHILAPTGLKTLICTDDSPGGQAATDFGCLLAAAAGAEASLLAVATPHEPVSRARERLESELARWREKIPRLGSDVRQGNTAAEIVRTAQEAQFELVVMGAHHRGLGETMLRVLENAEVPVLVVRESRERLNKILILTAAGEPGKADVRMAMRVAARTGASVTVLHVTDPDVAAHVRERAGRHLEGAKASLESANIEARAELRESTELVPAILAEAEAGDYDLLVIGAPEPSSPPRLASSIVVGSRRPVLIVPLVD